MGGCPATPRDFKNVSARRARGRAAADRRGTPGKKGRCSGKTQFMPPACPPRAQHAPRATPPPWPVVRLLAAFRTCARTARTRRKRWAARWDGGRNGVAGATNGGRQRQQRGCSAHLPREVGLKRVLPRRALREGRKRGNEGGGTQSLRHARKSRAQAKPHLAVEQPLGAVRQRADARNAARRRQGGGEAWRVLRD